MTYATVSIAPMLDQFDILSYLALMCVFKIVFKIVLFVSNLMFLGHNT